MAGTVLNLGCGPRRIEGAVNVDLRGDVGADVIHDLDVTPWPFPDSAFQRVVALDVLEHLQDPCKTMAEVHRVAAAGARVEITTPHYSCHNAWVDPTHRHAFAWETFDFLSGERGHVLPSGCRFRRCGGSIVFRPTPLNRLVGRLANRRPAAWERRWAWMFPAWFLYVELEVLK